MKVTVCELRTETHGFAEDWQALLAHVHAERSQLVLLPEMPFCPWFAVTREFDPVTWQTAVSAHEHWLTRLPELAPATVLGTRPVTRNGKRLNEGFVWSVTHGYSAVHDKHYLPEDEGFWESSWYERGDGKFSTFAIDSHALGMMICTELWFMQHARDYGQAGAQLIVTPRAAGKPTVDKWLAGGRVQAVVSGAYSLSSNHVSEESQVDLGGQGWIIGVDGEVLAVTSRQRPFVTLELDLAHADAAKHTYPRYVKD
ncbi:MAG: carbon-nitrogen hydrolase family protein [Anaerolineales bacterium]